jgi:SPP1 gp7 family putative phage head morphogenesis protein
MFFENLSDDFQSIENLLSDGIFAAYLLGFDESLDEHAALIEIAISKKPQANFSYTNFSYTNFSYPNDSYTNYPNYPHSIDFAGGDDKRAEKAANLDLRFDVAPSEAIDYFKRKKVLPVKEFYDLRGEARSAAFTVSGIYKQDVLEAFKQEIENALRDGSTRQSLVKRFKAILNGAGHKELGDFHLETVARTNMMMAYGVGRRRQMEESSGLLPFWQYNAVGDDRTRPTHRALDGVVLPADNPFWNDHFPPWGFRCRCSVSALLDQPKDYNPLKPNDDATLAYDENGVPVKAEIGTAVHDLSAGKFVGVPRQNVSLRETIETAAKQSADAKRISKKEVERLGDKKHLEDLQKLERAGSELRTPREMILQTARDFRNRNESVEILRAYDAFGKYLGETIGDAGSVNATAEIIARVNGGATIHWHPPQANEFFESFSTTDIISAVEWNETETFVVSKNYLYFMRPPNGTWSVELLDKILELYERYEPEIERNLRDKLFRDLASWAEIKDAGRHDIWKKIARKLKLSYKRIKL